MALNLLTPGLGLLRLGDAKRGLGIILVSLAFAVMLIGIEATAPTPDFTAYAIVAGGALAFALTTYIIAGVWTWRASAVRRDRPWWSRWYAMVAVWLAALVATSLLTVWAHRYYRPFYVPSEGMLPTLQVHDDMLADMRDHRTRRGDIVVFESTTPHSQWTKRIIGLPGDSVGMRDGILVLNGQPVAQRLVGTLPVADTQTRLARRLVERLPGEATAHEILDLGPTPQDDVAAETVPPGHVFVLGDNRDNSEDSRFPTEVGGVGMLPVSAIRGRPLFIYWSRDHSRIGRSLLAASH